MLAIAYFMQERFCESHTNEKEWKVLDVANCVSNLMYQKRISILKVNEKHFQNENIFRQIAFLVGP